MLIDYQQTKILLIDHSLDNWYSLSIFFKETKFYYNELIRLKSKLVAFVN